MDNIPTKSNGDQYTPAEFNSSNDEIKNTVLDTGQTLSGADLHQISKSMSNYSGSGDYFVDSGIADAYVLSVLALKQAPTVLVDGLKARFKVSNSNTGSSTVNLVGFGIKSIKKYGGVVDVEAGDLIQNSVAELSYVLALDVFELISIENPIVRESVPLFKNLTGLTLSNNGADPVNDLDVAPGTFRDTNTLSAFTLGTILTKKIDAAWVAGTNQGGFPSGASLTPDNWYSVFAIANAAGNVDVGFDDNILATNLLADATGYVFWRRIGSVYYETGAPNTIRPFTQIKNYFLWQLPVGDVSVNPVPTSQTFYTLTVPLGVSVEVHLSALISDESQLFGNGFVVCSPFVNDFTVTNTYTKGQSGKDIAGGFDHSFVDQILTDTNSQVWAKASATDGTASFYIVTFGWEELFD